MKRILCKLSAIILAICVIVGCGIAVSAASTPTQTYHYWSDVSTSRKAVYSKPMYEVETIIDSNTIGVGKFTQINSICTDDNGYLYILDSNSRVVILDYNYNFVREIGTIGGTETYKDAQGIYVYDNTIYICNTEGGCVLHITMEGELIEKITLPESPLIPDDFKFRPTRIVEDSSGYRYVLSDGSYYGALLYDNDEAKTFLGFYGANTVKSTVSSVLSNIQGRIFPNNEKLANKARELPYSFVDIAIDDDGFVYTCNGFTSFSQRKGQIRKLSPGKGTNIYDSENINFIDDDVNASWKKDFSRQDICDIEVDSKGFVYGIDSLYGKVFLFDDDCRTISVFGGGMGEGDQKGTFIAPTSLALKDDGVNVLVSDKINNVITVFRINDYGAQVKELINLTLTGDYDKTKDGWIDVIKQDANFQPAYSGLANAYLNEEDYEMAMHYAKIGYDRDVYEIAFEYVRKDFISDNFTIIFILLVVVVIGAIVFLVVSTKKNITLIKNKSLHLMFTTMIHPSNNFTDIKEKGLGSVPLSLILIVVYYVTTVLRTLAGGFLFTKYDPASFNSLWVLVRSVGLVVLWIVGNWLICTLLGGKGKIKEILIITCYSLLPLIFENIINIVLTNVLLPSESSFLGILGTIATIYFLLMLIIGMLKIHDFSMGRFIWTSLLTVFAMAAIVFLLILLVVLLQQFYGFIVTVVSELLTL